MGTEMSDQSIQIAQMITEHDYSGALKMLSELWNAHGEFGLRHCTVAGFEQLWVKYQITGYPFSLRRKWDEAKTDRATLELLLPHVAEWNLTTLDGQALELPDVAERKVELVDNVEDQVLMWMIRDFAAFWLTELLLPRKNS